jgi:hypothetical protein
MYGLRLLLRPRVRRSVSGRGGARLAQPVFRGGADVDGLASRARPPGPQEHPGHGFGRSPVLSGRLVRVDGEGSPLAFKVYIINGQEVFFGFYPVARHSVRIKGQQEDIYDLVGKDTMLFHHAADDGPDSIDFQYVEQARAWFESMWSTVAHEMVD